MMRARWGTWVLFALASAVLWAIVYACVVALSGCTAIGRYVNHAYTPTDTVVVDTVRGAYRKPPLVHYPRRLMRVVTYGSGAPFLRADGSLDSAVVAQVARYDIVTIYAPPLIARPDIVAELKARNPGLLILATLPGGVWENPHPMLGDTTTDLAWARWRVIRDHDAFLYGTDGRWLAPDDNVDRANHSASLALAGVDARASIPGVAGLWLDTICLGERWRESVADSIDYRRAGFACIADWERAYAEGHRIYAERLRELVGPGAILVGNCGGGGEQDVFNGWMRENFPHQNGGSWQTNMVSFNGGPGYLTENYMRPHLSILTGWVTGDTHRDSVAFMFGLASATLGDGAFEMDAPGMNTPVPFYWPPAFNADLGSPTGAAYEASAGVWRRDFTKGFAEVDVYAQSGRILAR